MKKFVSVSDWGAIRVLGVPLGTSANEVKSILKDFCIHENDNCLYTDKISINNLPELGMIFSKDEEDCVNQIRIGNAYLSQKECDNVYSYFKRELSDLDVVSEKEEGDCFVLTLSNCLHKVVIVKQRGLSNDENKYPFSMSIIGRLIEGGFLLNLKIDRQERNKAIKELYASNKKIGTTPNTSKRFVYVDRIIKILLLVFALILTYLLALNGRYIYTGNNEFFDKWTKIMLFVDKYEEITDE